MWKLAKQLIHDLKFILITWIIILILNQIFIFQGCVQIYCLFAALPHTGLITAIIYYFVVYKDYGTPSNTAQDGQDNRAESKPQNTNTKPTNNRDRPNDIYTQMGDTYEKYIGKRLEEKDEIVVYNGFIKGYEDKGIDLLSISRTSPTINLVQCKNWKRKELVLNDIVQIYEKLNIHYNDLDLYYLTSLEIYNHTQLQNINLLDIDDTMNNLRNNIESFTIRKTLYISSDKVVNMEIGQHLTMIDQNIFRYKDMKIVVATMDKYQRKGK